MRMNLILELLFALLYVSGVQAEIYSSIESEHFVVMFTEDADSALEIQEIAENFYPKVTSDLGYSSKRKIIIWFCESRKDFDRAINAPIQDWAVGCAYPLQARIVILDPAFSKDRRVNLSRLLKHEIVHVIFGLYIGENLRSVPRWFNEGLAMYVADDWSYGHYWAILTGTLSNSLISLFALSEEFPQSESRAQIAYAQCYSIIAFMVKRYGDSALKECIHLISEGRDFDTALASATGVDISWLESVWLKDLKKRYKWFSLLGSWVVLWGIVILILSIAFIRRKLKNRQIISQWEEEEIWAELEEENREPL